MCVGVRFRSESAWVFLIKISELRDSKSEFFFLQSIHGQPGRQQLLIIQFHQHGSLTLQVYKESQSQVDCVEGRHARCFDDSTWLFKGRPSQKF